MGALDNVALLYVIQTEFIVGKWIDISISDPDFKYFSVQCCWTLGSVA